MSDLEMPSCSSESTPKARTRHRCCECGGCIEVGETYTLLTGIWDGDPMTYKTCSDCKALRLDVEIYTEDDIALAGLHEQLSESCDIAGLERLKAIADRRGAWEVAVGIAKEILDLKEESAP